MNEIIIKVLGFVWTLYVDPENFVCPMWADGMLTVEGEVEGAILDICWTTQEEVLESTRREAAIMWAYGTLLVEEDDGITTLILPPRATDLNEVLTRYIAV